jgi:hypothetical protein
LRMLFLRVESASRENALLECFSRIENAFSSS